MEGKQENQGIGIIYFLGRLLLWGGLGYATGLRGPILKLLTLLGPISEQILNYSLEDVLSAIQREDQENELRARLAQEFEQPIKTPLLPKTKQEESPLSEALFMPNVSTPKDDSRLVKPATLYQPDSRWLDLVIPPSIVLILGGRGSGKTALGFRFLELFRYRLSPYVIGLPSQCAHLLPDWIGIKERLEGVPSNSISLFDEAYLSNHARDWAKAESRDLCRLLNLSRQQDKTIIFIAQQGRQIDLDIASSANVIVFKNPNILQAEFERPALRRIVADAKLAFETKSGDRNRWSYVYSLDTGSSGLVENNLPTFWNPKMSSMYGQTYIDEKASEKHPYKMTLEQKKEIAKELYEKGWSLYQIAKYLGVSKSTVFNWIHDYPYKPSFRKG
jgi:hypothetical protein